MRKTALVIIGLLLCLPLVGCDKDNPVEPNQNFEHFLQVCVKIAGEGTLVEQYRLVIVDNNTQQSATGLTSSGGWTEEFRWNSEPKSLWISGKAILGTLQAYDNKNIVPTCVDHPQWSKAKLCRATIEVNR